jgi:hypothetical protein
MMGVPMAHVAGIPIEETIGVYGPAVLLAFGAAWTIVRARCRRLRDGRGSKTAVSPAPEAMGPHEPDRSA